MAFPAASQEFAQVALSPSTLIYGFVADNSIFGVAVTVIVALSLKRRAVSFFHHCKRLLEEFLFNTFSEIS